MVLFVALLCIGKGMAVAQEDSTQTKSKLQPHFMVGTGVWSSGGEVRPYTTTGAQLDYTFNDKWTVTGGFMVYNEWNQNHYMIQGRSPRSYAPRKNNSSLIALNAGVQYNFNDRLSLAFSIYHLGGEMIPWWMPTTSVPFNVSVTGFSAELQYKLRNDSYLNFYLSFYRDNLGTMGIPLYPFYDSPWYMNRTLQNPYAPFFRGWYYY